MESACKHAKLELTMGPRRHQRGDNKRSGFRTMEAEFIREEATKTGEPAAPSRERASIRRPSGGDQLVPAAWVTLAHVVSGPGG